MHTRILTYDIFDLNRRIEHARCRAHGVASTFSWAR